MEKWEPKFNLEEQTRAGGAGVRLTVNNRLRVKFQPSPSLAWEGMLMH